MSGAFSDTDLRAASLQLVSPETRLTSVNPTSATDVDAYAAIAGLCEKGLLDAFFIVDVPAFIPDGYDGGNGNMEAFEPMTLMAALFQRTTHLGMIATASTI